MVIKVGVVGSRSRDTPKDKAVIKKALLSQLDKGKKLHLVSGGCKKGADKFAEELAEELNLGISIHSVDFPGFSRYNVSRWQYAQKAYERNTLIAEECDILMAVWDGISGGTADTIKKTEALSKPVIVL